MTVLTTAYEQLAPLHRPIMVLALRGLFDIATEINRLANATRDNKATLEELSGSTISITSLGALGGLVTGRHYYVIRVDADHFGIRR